MAASSEVSVVAVEDVPAEVVQKETDIEMGKEDILKKPENIRCWDCLSGAHMQPACSSGAGVSLPCRALQTCTQHACAVLSVCAHLKG